MYTTLQRPLSCSFSWYISTYIYMVIPLAAFNFRNLLQNCEFSNQAQSIQAMIFRILIYTNHYEGKHLPFIQLRSPFPKKFNKKLQKEILHRLFLSLYIGLDSVHFQLWTIQISIWSFSKLMKINNVIFRILLKNRTPMTPFFAYNIYLNNYHYMCKVFHSCKWYLDMILKLNNILLSYTLHHFYNISSEISWYSFSGIFYLQTQKKKE